MQGIDRRLIFGESRPPPIVGGSSTSIVFVDSARVGKDVWELHSRDEEK